MFGRKKVDQPQSADVVKHPARVLLMAARYVGAVAPPGTVVLELGTSTPAPRASSPPGRRFNMITDDGPGSVFFFPDHAAIWLNGEPQPRPGIPTEMIVNRIRGYEDALAYALKDIRDD